MGALSSATVQCRIVSQVVAKQSDWLLDFIERWDVAVLAEKCENKGYATSDTIYALISPLP